MTEFIADLLEKAGLAVSLSQNISRISIIVILILLALLINVLAKKLILSVIGRIVRKTHTTWDDIVLEKGVFDRLSLLVPSALLYYTVPAVLAGDSVLGSFAQRALLAYMIGVVVLIIESFLTSINEIYRGYKISKTRPIRGYIQVVKIFVVIIGLILMITTLLNQSALGLLSGIGALSAVILLVFKDSILGLVASIQLSGNDFVRIGDWIEMPSAGADGEVTDITLQTVLVRNWDKTIVTVPIYSLVSSSFKNWRGMNESGGRRIKRSLNIDMNTVKFCSNDMIEKFRRIDILADYIDSKTREIEEDNIHNNVNTSEMINGRRMTNLGTFRAYVGEYLRRHPMIHEDMTFLVRHLQPGPKGIPIEIYVFSKDQVWANYEAIQADIMDHLLAVVPFFDLAVFQDPGSGDLKQLGKEFISGK